MLPSKWLIVEKLSAKASDLFMSTGNTQAVSEINLQVRNVKLYCYQFYYLKKSMFSCILLTVLIMPLLIDQFTESIV